VTIPRGLVQGVISSTDGVTAQVDLGGSTIPATLLVHTASLGVGARVLVDRMRNQAGGSMLVVVGAFTSGTGGGTTYGPELLPNPSFEFGTLGAMPTSWNQFWSNPQPAAQSFAAWSNTPGVPHSGNGVCQVGITDAGDVVSHNVGLSDAIRVDPAAALRVGAWAKASATGLGVTVKAFVMTAPTADGAQPFGTGGIAADIAAVTDPGSAWQELAGPFIVPAGHNYLRLYLNTATPSGVAVNVWWDDASVKQTS
jgi:hypothetical protein